LGEDLSFLSGEKHRAEQRRDIMVGLIRAWWECKGSCGVGGGPKRVKSKIIAFFAV
jgi:hypothetical protein